MIAGALFFATMAVCVKYASSWFNSSELVFWRGLLGMLFMWLLARSQGITLATHYPLMHAWRSLVGVVSLGAWFYALATLPLATAMTLNYMSSVWVAAFLVGGALIAWNPRNGEPWPARQGVLALAVIAGFVGVVLMLRPSVEQNQVFGAIVGLLSGITAAFAYMQVMALGKIGEPDTRTVFYFAVGSAIAGALGMMFESNSGSRSRTGAMRGGSCRSACWPRWASCASRAPTAGARRWWSRACSISASCSAPSTASRCSVTRCRRPAGSAWR